MTDSTLRPGAGGPEGYRLLELLGRGAYGEVWRAEAPGGVKVAIKVLYLEVKPAEAKRELAALHSMMQLRHPYLLSLQAIFYHGDSIFVVMELADGSLRSRLNSCRVQGQPGIPVTELLRYMQEAAEAIDFLHADGKDGVVHRDIKPDNILLLSGHAKVADYGLARILEQQQTVRTDSVLGTPAYMAPETWEGTVGPRSDQYGLAATYAELRCGRRPFEATNRHQWPYIHLNQPPNLEGIPKAERLVLEKALAKKSDDRYRTCGEFAEALVRAAKNESASTTEALPHPDKPSEPGEEQTARRDRKVIMLIVAAIVVCSIFVVVFAYTPLTHLLLTWGETKPPSDTRLTEGGLAQNPPADTRKESPGSGLKGGDLAEVEIAAGVKMKFCWIPPGKATLGSPATENGHDDSEKEHEYTSRGFWLAKFPVTQEEWRALMKDNPSYFNPDQNDIKKAGIQDTSHFPVENVCWDDPNDRKHSAQEFLRTLNFSVKAPAKMGKGKFALPLEDDWEYACRGDLGNKRPFYFGDELNGDLANCDGDAPFGTEVKGPYKERTTQVGEYEKVAPHPWGLCDMHGNVWQWCENSYENDKDSRVLRGGSWGNAAQECRSAHRNSSAPDRHSELNYGFRVCFRPD
jgi:serine/threonine protein kinase